MRFEARQGANQMVVHLQFDILYAAAATCSGVKLFQHKYA
jgi:hypothetical protein